MEAAALGAVLCVTLPWLRDRIQQVSNKKQRGLLQGHLICLEQELRYMSAKIKDYGIANPDDISNLQSILIGDLSSLAYDIEDCTGSFGVKFIDESEFDTKISYLKERAKQIKDKLEGHISKESPRHPASSSRGMWQDQDKDHYGAAVDPIHGVVGMDKPSSELKALLRESQDKKLRVIFIVGFGGLGKTLLASRVFRENSEEFCRRAFVCAVGKHPNAILGEIQEKLQNQGVQRSQGDAVHVAINHTDVHRVQSSGVHGDTDVSGTRSLQSCPGTDRYLIVIDDARSPQLVSHVIAKLTQTTDVDSRIIITTTQHKVAEATLGSVRRHLYKMRPLDEGDSVELFRKVACPDWSTSTPDKLSSEYCGVPLAVVSIAQRCGGDVERSQEAWRKLCDHEGDDQLERMQQVLHDSYNSLCDHSLQQCFLYLCMFPWNRPINRGPLMRRWLAERLALKQDKNGIIPSVDFSLENFKTLIGRNVLWPLEMSTNNQVKTCQVPGVMLGYITSKSKSENFLMLSCGDGTSNPEDTRRLSLHGTHDSDTTVHVLSKDLPRLRTLAVFDESENHPLSFAKCRLLRVLDLEAYRGLRKHHADEIRKLLLLKYLSLGQGISQVPREILDLKWLETLQVPKETVVTVPADILMLPHLKHLLGKLKLRRPRKTKGIKVFLRTQSKLEKLAGFVADDDKKKGFPLLMRHMKRLRKVKIWYSSTASEDNIKQLSESIHSFLSEAQRIPTVRHTLSVDFREYASEPFQNSLICSGSLSYLKLRGTLATIPSFLTNLSAITELCLWSTTLSWNAIVATAADFDALKYLKIVSDCNVEGDIVVQKTQFKSLKRLCLVAEQNVAKLEIKSGALNLLISLHMLVPSLDATDQIQDLKSLEEIQLDAGMPNELKQKWKQAAGVHPNRPSVLFIGRT